MNWQARIGLVSVVVAVACKREPASVEDLYTTRMVALSYLQRDQLPQAESSFKKLTELAPDDPLGYADLGLTYLQAGRIPRAGEKLGHPGELDTSPPQVGLAP